MIGWMDGWMDGWVGKKNRAENPAQCKIIYLSKYLLNVYCVPSITLGTRDKRVELTKLLKTQKSMP